MSILETYEHFLREATVDEVVSGGFELEYAHQVEETTLFRIWRNALLPVFESEDGESFASLSDEDQRTYFRPDSLFRFERFRNSFLKRFCEHNSIVLN